MTPANTTRTTAVSTAIATRNNPALIPKYLPDFAQTIADLPFRTVAAVYDRGDSCNLEDPRRLSTKENFRTHFRNTSPRLIVAVVHRRDSCTCKIPPRSQTAAT